MFDFTPVLVTHGVLFVVAFALVYGVLAWLLKNRKWLRASQHDHVPYGGTVFVSVSALLVALALGPTLMSTGLLAAALVVLGVGTFDEELRLSARTQLAIQVLLALLLTLSGWNITEVTNLMGEGVWELSAVWLSVPLSVLWFVILINALNWLDGSDGVASGVGVVSLLVLAAVAVLPSIQDGEALSIALIGTGACLAFLLLNWAPARVYLGTSGSWWLGIYIAVAALIGGGKVVTTVLLLTIPLMDVVLVVTQRLRSGHPIWKGDTTRHIHHRLRAWSLSERGVAGTIIAATAVLGVAALTLQTHGKILAGIIAALVFVGFGLGVARSSMKRQEL